MTDLLSPPTPASDEQSDSDSVRVVWLPPEKKAKRGRIALWLGIPSGLIVAAAAACAMALIAPGVLVAGVDVGWRTPGFASELVTNALADTSVTFDTPTRDITLTGEQLGLSVDAKAIAELAHSEYALWNVGAWNPGDLPIEVIVDPAAANAALTAAAPSIFPAPANAKVTYDSALATFGTVDSKPGLGVNLTTLATAVSAALSSGSTTVTVDASPVRVTAPVSTAEARKQANSLNALIANAGFYVEGTKVVGVDPAVAASWVTVSVKDGELQVDVDTKAALTDIKPVVATLRKTADRPVVDTVIVTNSAGEHLRTVQEGVEGWKLVSTAGVADGFVESFAAGDGTYDLEGKDVAFKTTLAFRSIEVDKSDGVTILYENGQVVDTYPIAVGRPETATDEGRFTVYAQLTIQDMGCTPAFDYCTKNVPWITYFNGDEGFHGTYWHDNFGAGAMMSHGCVNMTLAAAERLYRFAQVGTEVWVHE